MDQSLRHEIGQMLLTGLPPEGLTPEALEQMDRCRLGNHILFGRDLPSAEAGADLCARLSQGTFARTGLSPLIAADQEGGTVCRITQGAAAFPGAMAMAAACGDRTEEIALTGRECGRLLRAMGANMDLAPVLDVNLEPMNPVIGSRSYGDRPERVAQLGCAMMEGLAAGGVLPTVKHYPGHGCVRTDSHLDLPVNRKTLDQLRESELIPFRRAVERGAAAVMSCHILFPEIDPDLPATLSPRLIEGLLRAELGFAGLVVTDCLEMEAIKARWGVAQGAVLAVQAGCDLLCISHHLEESCRAADAICQAVEEGRIPRERIRQSFRRVLDAKEKLGLLAPQSISAREAAAAAADPETAARHRALARRSVTLVREEGGLAALKRGGDLLVLAPPARQGTQVQSQTSGLSFARLAGQALNCPWQDISREPTPEEIAALAAQARGRQAVVAGLFNARFRPSQQALVEALAKEAPVVAVMLGEPYDLEAVRPAKAVIAAYEYTSWAAQAAAEALAEGEFFGKWPLAI